MERAFEVAPGTFAQAVATFEDISRADPQNNQPVRKLATVYQYIGDVHRDMADAADGDSRPSDLQTTKETASFSRKCRLLFKVRRSILLETSRCERRQQIFPHNGSPQ